MMVFFVLVLLGLILLWFLLTPIFGSIGGFIIDKITNLLESDEINIKDNKGEKET